MATLSIPYTLADSTPAYGSQVRLNDDAIVNFVNASVVHADGAIAMSGALTLPSGTPTSTQAVRRDYMESVTGMGAWTSYTPTWTAATTNPVLGNSSISGRYIVAGKKLDLSIILTIGSTTTLGTGAWRFSLPAGLPTPVSFVTPHSGVAINAGGTVRRQVAPWATTSSYVEVHHDSGLVAAAVPFAWASGDTLYLTLRGVELS